MGCWISKCSQEPEEDNAKTDGSGQSGVFNPTSYNTQTSGGFHMFEFHGGTVGNMVILIGVIAVIVLGAFIGWRFVKKRIQRRREDAFARDTVIRFSHRRALEAAPFDMVGHMQQAAARHLAIGAAAPSAPQEPSHKLPPHYCPA